VPVQVILIAVAMVAFNQDWHVEEERQIGDEIDVEEEPKPLPSRMRNPLRRANQEESSERGDRPARGG